MGPDVGMSASAARRLAVQVRDACGHEVTVRAEDGYHIVDVVTLGPGVRNVFTLRDESDWDGLRPRILG